MAEDLTMMLPIGTLLKGDTYRIEGYLGSGGFGKTYSARHVQLGKQVAIKEFFLKNLNLRDSDNTTVSVSSSDSGNKETFERQLAKFNKEAKRLASLDNKHIVKVGDLFSDNGTAYYVMDYIDGESLKDKVKKGVLGEQQVRDILDQILDALQCIHSLSNPIYHLDIKPGNIMLTSDGTAKLIDFGASKQLSQGASTSTAMCYTPGYAPLEQMENVDDAASPGRHVKIGPWTDLYALGATMYNLLTGEAPPKPTDIDDDGAGAFHFRPSTSGDMRSIIQWLMQTNRRNRPQSVAQVRQRLNGASATAVQDDTDGVTLAAPTQHLSGNAKGGGGDGTQKSSKSMLMYVLAALIVALACAAVYHFFFRKPEPTKIPEETNLIEGVLDSIHNEDTQPKDGTPTLQPQHQQEMLQPKPSSPTNKQHQSRASSGTKKSGTPKKNDVKTPTVTKEEVEKILDNKGGGDSNGTPNNNPIKRPTSLSSSKVGKLAPGGISDKISSPPNDNRVYDK